MTRVEIESLAAAYDAAMLIEPGTLEAYAILARYVHARFGKAHADGWRVQPVTHDAPPDIETALRTHVLPVYDRDHAHPLFTDGENFMLRAVHDIYGHFADPAAPHPFSFEGELAACKAQRVDLRRWASDKYGTRVRLAERALYAEVVGQAAYFEVHGRFPVQKAVLL